MKIAKKCVDFVSSAGILFGNCRSREATELLLLAESWASRGWTAGSDTYNITDHHRRTPSEQLDVVSHIVGVPGPRLHCISLLLLDLERYAGIYVRKLWNGFTKSLVSESQEDHFLSRERGVSYGGGGGCPEFQDDQESSQEFDEFYAKYKTL